MSAESATVRVFQLVYANVEAHESANNFRGFQVWLASPELDDSVRAEVSRQLADFNLPDGAEPFNARGQPLERHLFYSVEAAGGPWWVLARTVPVKDTDIYGRMGLFLVHALVLTDEAMRLVGYEPFALLQSKPAFADGRAEAKALAPDWKLGLIPAIDVPVVASPPAAIDPLTPGLIVEIVQYLEQPAEGPITLTEHPRDVLNWLRPLFSRLPPPLRGRLGFDTLYNGQSLAGAPFRVVGSFSPDTLSTWSDQRVHQWLGGSATFAPPLKRAPTCFSVVLGEWLHRDGMPSDATMTATYELLRAIEQERLVDCRPRGLTEAALRELVRVEPIPTLIKKLQLKRVRTDFPVKALWPIVQERLPEYFRAETMAERLERIAVPLSAEQIGRWMTSRLEDPEQGPPTPEELDALMDWLADRDGEEFLRCRLMAQRWRGDVEWLRDHFPDDVGADPGSWFWTWCRRTLERRYGEGTELALRLLSALRGAEVADEVVADTQLYLMMPRPEGGWVEVESENAEIRFWLAYHRGDIPEMIQLMNDPANRALYPRAMQRLERAPCLATFCCFVIDGEIHVGIKLEFTSGRPGPSANLAMATFHHDVKRSGEFWRRVATRGHPAPIEQRRIESRLPAIVEKARDREQWEMLTEFLQSPRCTDTIFQQITEELLTTRIARPFVHHIGSEVVWLGLRVGWAILSETRSRNAQLLAVLNSVTSVVELPGWDAIAHCQESASTDKCRLGWLLMILLDQQMVGKLVINR